MVTDAHTRSTRILYEGDRKEKGNHMCSSMPTSFISPDTVEEHSVVRKVLGFVHDKYSISISISTSW